jgi:DNA-binding MurR/RpiR family transcriptional regulator
MEETRHQFPLLRSAYHGLTKSEQRIAEYIMEHADTIMEETIPRLASHTGSSEITVSRFCKKLGFSGLQSLKIALAAELSSEGDARYQEIHPEDSYAMLAEKVFQNISDGLTDTLKLLDYQAVEQAVDVLVKAKRIAVYGFGNSATVCRDIETRFLRFGMVVQAYADAHQQVTSASLLTSEDVVIAISHTGATIAMLDTVKVAKKNGATIIVITSYAKSSLAELADITLIGMGREVHYRSEAVASRLIHMAITDVLYTGIAMKIPARYRNNISRMRAVIAEKRV